MKLRSGLLCSPLPKQLFQLPLTQENLQAFDGKTNSDKSDSETHESMPSSTDPEFPVLLYENGVYFNNRHVLPPRDKNKILKYLQQERSTLNKLQSQKFLHRFKSSVNEETYKVHFIYCLFHLSSKKVFSEYSMQMDFEWTKVTGTAVTMRNLSNPKPDYFEAFLLSEYPSEVWDALGWCIRPSSHMVAMSTFCVEFKAPGKGPRNAIAQAACDGAVMIDAAWETHKYMKKPARDFFGKTKALVIAIADQTFQLFACHAMPAVDWNKSKDEYPRKINYHIFQLAGTMINSEDELKIIYRLIRNAQDWCYVQAQSVKEDLRKHFEMLKKEEMQKERKKNDARRIVSDAMKKEKRKRTLDEAELEQDPQELTAKRRKIRDSSDGSDLLASTAGQNKWFTWPMG